MAKPFYQRYDIPEGLADDALSVLESVSSGEIPNAIRRGTNETTKAIERGKALLVLIALDVDPPEIVAHLPLLCEEKKIPFVFVPTKSSIGAACGLKITSASCAIVEAGPAKKKLESVATKAKELAGI
ncbi:MAG: 50S ribosomal protein L7Ae [Candidatus Heimdallarchaeota archaeon]